MESLLKVTGLHVSVDGTPIIQGLDLTIPAGEIHAIMGPNGSGKSTLVHALMGHPAYHITAGSVEYRGQDLLAMEPHERALAGVFLAFQYPREITGVSLRSFLLAAHRARAAVDDSVKRLSPLAFDAYLKELMQGLEMDTAFADRSVNQGFSGGEKKKAEILQMAVLQPALALMDETDSGLDVDALKIVAEGVVRLRAQAPESSVLVVTHYARILSHLTPDVVHVMVRGRIVESGDASLATQLEAEGYARFGAQETVRIALDDDAEIS